MRRDCRILELCKKVSYFSRLPAVRREKYNDFIHNPSFDNLTWFYIRQKNKTNFTIRRSKKAGRIH